jgi:hypothetical protein
MPKYKSVKKKNHYKTLKQGNNRRKNTYKNKYRGGGPLNYLRGLGQRLGVIRAKTRSNQEQEVTSSAVARSAVARSQVARSAFARSQAARSQLARSEIAPSAFARSHDVSPPPRAIPFGTGLATTPRREHLRLLNPDEHAQLQAFIRKMDELNAEQRDVTLIEPVPDIQSSIASHEEEVRPSPLTFGQEQEIESLLIQTEKALEYIKAIPFMPFTINWASPYGNGMKKHYYTRTGTLVYATNIMKNMSYKGIHDDPRIKKALHKLQIALLNMNDNIDAARPKQVAESRRFDTGSIDPNKRNNPVTRGMSRQSKTPN